MTHSHDWTTLTNRPRLCQHCELHPSAATLMLRRRNLALCAPCILRLADCAVSLSARLIADGPPVDCAHPRKEQTP